MSLIKPAIFLLVFTATLFLCHHFIISATYKDSFFYATWHIYAFLGVSAFIILFVTHFIHKNLPDKTGFTFMALSIFKIAASVLFFIPLMKADVPDPVGDVLNFFVPYFLFLIVEVLIAIRLINSN
jgi:hypothetical protein